MLKKRLNPTAMMLSPLSVAMILMAVASVGLGQDSEVLTLENGDRRFEFDVSMECIDSPQDWRLVAPRFLALRIDDSFFVSRLRRSCPSTVDRGGFTNVLGDSLRNERVCHHDRYTLPAPESDQTINCDLGPFWPVSRDIGASLMGRTALLANRDEPVRLAVVPAKDLQPLPDEITFDQAFLQMMDFPTHGFETCAAGCAEIRSLTFPGCLQTGAVREYLWSTLSLLLPAAEATDIPPASCGCATFELTADGGVANPRLLFSSSAKAGEAVTQSLSDIEPVGQLPPQASCLSDMTVPLPFYR